MVIAAAFENVFVPHGVGVGVTVGVGLGVGVGVGVGVGGGVGVIPGLMVGVGVGVAKMAELGSLSKKASCWDAPLMGTRPSTHARRCWLSTVVPLS